MPLRVRNNTKYAPFTVNDLIKRNGVTGVSDLIDNDIIRHINNEWIYFITQPVSYSDISTNLITAYIYEMYKNRVILAKYSDEFDGWEESTDFSVFVGMIKNTISIMLLGNKEKYNKLYKAMTVEFNPLWNVDGETITERELKQTGTIDDTKTGTETDRRTGTEATERTGTDTTAHTGTETDVLDETARNTKTGTEATAHTGTNTQTTANTTYDSAVMYDTSRVTDAPNTTDTLTHNTVDNTDTDATDTKTYNTTHTDTHNTTDTLTHNTTDTLTHNTLNSNERDLTDKETIKEIRRGNIGVTTTTKLLTEFVEFANAELLNFIDVIAKDIVNSFTYLVY